MSRPRGFAPIRKTLGLCPKLEDLGALPQTLLGKLLEKFPKTFQNFNHGGFSPSFYVVPIFL